MRFASSRPTHCAVAERPHSGQERWLQLCHANALRAAVRAGVEVSSHGAGAAVELERDAVAAQAQAPIEWTLPLLPKKQ